MKITAKNIAQQSIKFRKKVQEDIKKHIVKIRADIIKHIIMEIIYSSPVKTGTYVRSHTLCINGMLVKRADIYFKETSPALAYGEAISEFMSNEYQRALESDAFDKISIVVPSTMFFYWGETYVEPTYGVYSRARAGFNKDSIVSALVQTAMAVMRSSDEDIVKHRKKIKSKKEKN